MADPLPPIDPNVKLPRGVVASSANAEAVHATAYNTPPAGGDGATAPARTEAAPPQPTNPSPPPPAPAPAQAAPQPPPANQPPPETADDWKQRYQSLKGRHDQLTGTVANQNARLASLETLISQLQTAPPRPTPQPQPTPKPASKRVTDKDVAEFGTEMLDVVRRAALDAVEPEIERRVSDVRNSVQSDLKKVNDKVGVVEKDTAVSAHQRLLDALDKGMPNWRQVNRHPKFHQWLALTDPLSGVIRKNLLDNAVSRGDVRRAATFYASFLAEEGVPAPANGNTSPPPPSNGNGAARVDLASLAAPGRPAASGSPQQTPENKPIITRAQISTFYSNKQKGLYPPEEAAAHEKLIFEATKDGRVR